MIIKTKYSVGDKIWLMINDEVRQDEVTYVYTTTHNTPDAGVVTKEEYGISCRTGTTVPFKLFATKEELLKSL